MKAQSELCVYSELRIYTGNKKNTEDLIIGKMILELVKKKQIDLRFKLAGVEFEEILIKKSSMATLQVEEVISESGNIFTSIKGFFKAEDVEYFKYILYCFVDYKKSLNSFKIQTEVMHKVDLSCKFQVVVINSTKEKELVEFPELVFQNQN